MGDKGKPAPSNAPSDVQRFINDLNASPSGEQVLHGMVKPSDANDGLLFAHPGACDHWICLPASSIQTIRRTGRVACAGHSHVTAEIELKLPQSDLEKTFASVAGLHQVQLSKLRAGVQFGLGAAPQCPEGYHYGPNDFGQMGCWPGP